MAGEALGMAWARAEAARARPALARAGAAAGLAPPSSSSSSFFLLLLLFLLLPPLLLLSFSSSSGDAARGAARAGDKCEEADFGLQASYVTTCAKPPQFFITASTYDILTSFMIFELRLLFIEFKNNSIASSWSCFVNKMLEIGGLVLDTASHYTKKHEYHFSIQFFSLFE